MVVLLEAAVAGGEFETDRRPLQPANRLAPADPLGHRGILRLVLDLPELTGVTCKLFAPAPLPFDLDGWRRRIVGLDRDDVRLVSVETGATEDGWPYTLAVSDRGGTRCAHAFIEILHWGVVALAHGDPAALDAGLPAWRAALGRARPDLAGDEAPTLAALWRW